MIIFATQLDFFKTNVTKPIEEQAKNTVFL